MRQRDHTNELGDECVRCPRGSYNLDGSVWNDQSKPLQSGTLAPPDGFCLPCPRAGASCPGGSEVYAKEGWYTHEIERQSSRRISHGPPDDNTSMTCGGTCVEDCPSSSRTFSDGSGDDDYEDNADCWWLIEAPGAEISVSFSSFETESDYDYVSIFRCVTAACESTERIARLSGTLSASTVYSSTTGFLKVTFTSDSSATRAGFTGTWDVAARSQASAPDDNTSPGADCAMRSLRLRVRAPARCASARMTGVDRVAFV